MSSDANLAAFLAAAEALLRERVAPTAVGDARFAALMTASGVGMAARELALRPRLAATAAAIEGLAPAIRGGARDGDAETYRLLVAAASARTAATRPQALTEEERALTPLPEGDRVG